MISLVRAREPYSYVALKGYKNANSLSLLAY
jgi:hypothetical protein